MRMKVLAVSAIAALIVAVLAYAGPWGHRGFRSGPYGGPMMAHHGYGHGPGYCAELWPALPDLTDEQREKVEELRVEFQAQAAEIEGELQAKLIELRDLWTDPEAGDDEILAKTREVWALRDQLSELALKHRLQIRSLLTPDQIRRIGRGPRRGPRMGFGPWGGFKMRPGPRGGWGMMEGYGPGYGPHGPCW
jgi:Spy/CpxP family protein refolding chaperone